MQTLERAIWKSFIQVSVPEYDWIVEENVIAPLTAEGSRHYGKGDYGFWYSCQLRADAMVSIHRELTMVEVEETLNTAGIGQLVSYSAIWNYLNPATPVKQLWLVALYTDDRLIPALKATNIELKLVNELRP